MQDLVDAVNSGRDVVVCQGFNLSAVVDAVMEPAVWTLWVGFDDLKRQGLLMDGVLPHASSIPLVVDESAMLDWVRTWLAPPRVVYCEPQGPLPPLPSRLQKIVLTRKRYEETEAFCRAAGIRDPLIVDGGGKAAEPSAAMSSATEEQTVAMAFRLEKLREWRAHVADREEVKRYRVFSDRVLMALAWAAPVDEASFLAVSGCGPKKWDHYGPQLTALFLRHSGVQSRKR